MPRPQRCRRICGLPRVGAFGPQEVRAEAPIVLTLDEYEVIRLVDLEEKTQGACAAQMDVSRSTVQEIYESARKKIAACLAPDPHDLVGGATMKIAVTYENGQIFQHFGHTQAFKIYEITDGQISRTEVVDTNGSGHGALAGFLMQRGVDTLSCGGIGGGAQAALANAGIRLFGGVSGDADAAAEALVNGTLNFNPAVHCDHHEHAHGEGHTCGEHGRGRHPPLRRCEGRRRRRGERAAVRQPGL